MVRALQPWPGVLGADRRVGVQIEAGGLADISGRGGPRSVARCEGESVVIAARDGGYRVDLITPPGKRAMTPAAFLRGRHSSDGSR